MSSAIVSNGRAPAETRIDELPPLAQHACSQVDPTIWLKRLRQEFPRWAFLFDPWAAAWVAVKGWYHIEVADTAIALRDALHSMGDQEDTGHRPERADLGLALADGKNRHGHSGSGIGRN